MIKKTFYDFLINNSSVDLDNLLWIFVKEANTFSYIELIL